MLVSHGELQLGQLVGKVKTYNKTLTITEYETDGKQ